MDERTETLETQPGAPGRFFRRIDWSAFWTACLASFAVYVWTLAPTVTLEDSGELAVAGDYMGVPHPPGYPIWSMLSWVFARVFSFVTFRGQPNPAWSIALQSAVFGALAAGVTALLVCRSGADILRRSKDVASHVDTATDNMICWVAGVASSLVFAFSPVMWSQAVIVEVYALNAFFLMLIFLLVYMWLEKPSARLLYVTAFIFGLGLTNYQVLLLAALALAVAILVRDVDLFRDFLITGAPFVIVLGLIKAGVLPGIEHPLHISCFLYLALNFTVLGLAYFLLPRGRTVALSLLFLEMGVAFYGYMPIVSDLRNPPMNWGYPRTWQGFQHAISRGQYERIVPSNVYSMHFLYQAGFYLTDLRRQFYLPVALLGFLPLTTWRLRLRKTHATFNALLAAMALCILASAVAIGERLLGFSPDGKPLELDKLLVGVVILMIGVGAAGILVTQAREQVRKLTGRTAAALSQRATVAVVLLGGGLLFLYHIKRCVDLILQVTAPLRQSAGGVPSEQLGGLVLQTGGLILLALLPALVVAGIAWLLYGRSAPVRLEMTIDDESQKWVTATLVAFLTLSVGLIALANFKLDIQDTFIQRVKLISSHGLFAIWMGYGIMYGLAMLDTLLHGNRTVKWLSMGVALLLPLAPFGKNWIDAQLIKEYGGAEQNGHDFGWQFGNYQLRGAEAIREELSPDEEPLPDPYYPPEMTRNAIFFGGTDPGRFVPTYMIYSARVREDVYLITQNALADNTYMSVMRDLYGDQIWIPAQPDSARAFQRYVEDIKSGRAPKNADVQIENGRVQVSGALGVMEINGILCEMIFERNKSRHDFYVEESYVIRWMYPYLTPHGLIMKINAEHTPLDPALVRRDQDFWDWYTRRLTDNEAFMRDVVARKSFSKLRSALAGLYANRGLLDDAEQAFKQARLLYLLSPDANFRLVQETFLRQDRFDEAMAIMEEFADEDPGNSKALSFIAEIERLRGIKRTIADLETRMTEGKLEINQAMQLLDLYLKTGQGGRFNWVAGDILKNPSVPPMYQFRLAQLFHQAGQLDKMTEALDLCTARLPPDTPPQVLLDIVRLYAATENPGRMHPPLNLYLGRQPQDWKAWLDMATLELSLRQTNAAGRALEQAIRFGGSEALAIIRQNPHLAQIQNTAASRRRNLFQIP
jgi:tetratricopeptide (TPR) repeat protein